MISDPKILEQIYITKFADFSESFVSNSDDPLDVNSILNQGGEQWKRARTVSHQK